jgi:hypothetical protein
LILQVADGQTKDLAEITLFKKIQKREEKEGGGGREEEEEEEEGREVRNK